MSGCWQAERLLKALTLPDLRAGAETDLSDQRQHLQLVSATRQERAARPRLPHSLP